MLYNWHINSFFHLHRKLLLKLFSYMYNSGKHKTPNNLKILNKHNKSIPLNLIFFFYNFSYFLNISLESKFSDNISLN